LHKRLWTTYRDALIFCVAYALSVWVLLILATPLIVQSFGLEGTAAEVLRAFTITTGGAQALMGMVFVTNAAFNTLGRPGRSMVVNWSRDGLLMLPVAYWAASIWGAPGVLYGQAIAGSAVGIVGAVWAGVFVRAIANGTLPELDLTPRRGYRDLNRFRRR
jgi:Na+-driven multidrug efflux pump